MLFLLLGSTIYCCLLVRSRYLPRALALFGVAGSALGVLNILASFLFPASVAATFAAVRALPAGALAQNPPDPSDPGRLSRDEPSARHSPVAFIHGRVRRKWIPGQARGPGRRGTSKGMVPQRDHPLFLFSGGKSDIAH